jgi:vacuolar-type H+-ATPase subunit E/Vma4
MANGYGIDFETESDILRRRERGLSEALETVKKRLEELSASSDGAV